MFNTYGTTMLWAYTVRPDVEIIQLTFLLCRFRSQVHVSRRRLCRVADTAERNAAGVRREVESTHSARCRPHRPQR